MGEYSIYTKYGKTKKDKNLIIYNLKKVNLYLKAKIYNL